MTSSAPTMMERSRYGEGVDSPRRILVIRAGALGDCLLMLPTLAALRERFPQACIDVMGYPLRWAWVLGRGLVDEVHTIDRAGMHLLFGEGAEVPAPLKTFLGTYDVILSYRPDPEQIFATNLRRLGVRLVPSQSPFPPPPPPKIHVADFALRLVAELGASPSSAVPRLQLTAGELALAQPFFRAHDVDPWRERIVVVHPGSGGEAKRWPMRSFAALAEALAAQGRVRLVIVVGYAEQAVAAEFLPRIRRAKPLVAEHWPLIPTASLIAHAAVFIGNDSGLTHLAAALGRPTVAIFGPTDPEIWGPRGEHVTIVPLGTRGGFGTWRAPGGTPYLDEWTSVLHVLQAVQRWLVEADFTQSPSGRSAQS
jgi:ADP-heptose:LPS heptosyltransferase